MSFSVISQPVSGTVTIYKSSSGGGGSALTWYSVSSNTAMFVSSGYFVTQGSSQIVMTLPTSATNGAMVAIECLASSPVPAVTGVKIQSSGSQTITIGSQISATGGSIQSTFIGASAVLVYNSTLNTWVAGDISGSFSVN